MTATERGFAAPVLVPVLAIAVLLLGGIGIDLWRVVAAHRGLVGIADAAAASAATALDELAYRRDPVRQILEPALARARACESLREHGIDSACPGARIAIDVGLDRVTVRLTREIDFAMIPRFLIVTGGGREALDAYAESTVALIRAPMPP